ncbi:MAG: low molecular weight phosphotyrosine protein phosphatase [Muribaculaceae bacterium]|nr:low molecular weight phosphotyrosine protein phosphatase [Muribaculaceae bacterium]
MNSTNPKKTRVLFVCLGNICRSPAAEGIFRSIVDEHRASDLFDIDSAGTGNYHIGELPDRRMRVHARNRGIELTHRCRQVDVEDFNDFDLIIGMDASNLQNLRRMAPSVEAARKIRAMAEFFSPGARYDHVPDPYYEGSEGFELVLDLLDDGCRNLFNRYGGI